MADDQPEQEERESRLGTCVSLSSGDNIYVDALAPDVNQAIRRSNGSFVPLGRQLVNPAQVVRVYDVDLYGVGEPEKLYNPL